MLYSLCEQTRAQINSPDFTIPEISDKTQAQLEKYIEKYQIKRCMKGDSDYHFKFLQVPSKPSIVYYIGNIDLLNQNILGVVGPRIATNYGKKVVHDLLERGRDFQIASISGLAPGIDTLCHEQSIDNQIPTIAVLGGGLDYYLRNRQSLIEKIIGNGGLILSEFKIGFKPTNYSFPQRNRIIAGLSDAVFLPEASEKSGSLITVDFALKVGKKVFASPNDIYNAHSTGVNKYISEHKIQAIYHLQDFLETCFIKKSKHGITSQEKIQVTDLDSYEKRIIEFLRPQARSTQELMNGTGMDIALLGSYLSLLELKGIIQQSNTGIFELR